MTALGEAQYREAALCTTQTSRSSLVLKMLGRFAAKGSVTVVDTRSEWKLELGLWSWDSSRCVTPFDTIFPSIPDWKLGAF